MTTQQKLKIIQKGLKENLSHSEIASLIGITRQGVFNHIKKYGLKYHKDKKIKALKEFAKKLKI